MDDNGVSKTKAIAKKQEVVARDELGFVTSDMPDFSASQVQFLLAIATTGNLEDAARMAGVGDGDVLEWMSDPVFTDVYAQFLRNKREGVKQIGQQLLPLSLLELVRIIESGKDKEKLQAIKLLMQMQGMLITNNAPIDKGTLEALREQLMRPRPTHVLEGSFRDVTKKEG